MEATKAPPDMLEVLCAFSHMFQYERDVWNVSHKRTIPPEKISLSDSAQSACQIAINFQSFKAFNFWM